MSSYSAIMYETSLPKLVLLSRDPLRVEQWQIEIEAQGRHQVVSTGRSAAEAMTLAAQIDPDAIISDLQLLDSRAAHFVRRSRQGVGNAGMMILLVAPAANDPDLLECLRYGADSYYVDQGPGPSLDGRIHEMLQGESKMSPEIAREVLNHFMRDGSMKNASRPLDEMMNPLTLSGQERSILLRLVQGQSVPDIASAERLHVPHVARTIRGLYRKMEWDLRAGDLQLTQF